MDDTINLTTLQAVLRYKLKLESPLSKLDFKYTEDNSKVTVYIDNKIVLRGKLDPPYIMPQQRALAFVSDLEHIPSGELLPTAHQSYLLAALYERALL